MTASNTKLPEPDLSGHTIDRYLLLRRLGVGGMGAVYEAEHTRLRKRLAVKLLRYEFARNDVFRKRFLREARAASAIAHPNVVAISDFGETAEDHVFFAMELLVGRDLQELLEAEKKLPWPRTREILLQITSALQAAHMQDIIHRDMKPSNVFLADVPGKSDEDFVKVLDFGIAKLSGTTGEATSKLTSTDEIFGTVAYMAPEVPMGTSDDRRSDVYSVGVMMYRMLTGELPFIQGNAFQILSQHINAPVPPPREKEPSISVEVQAVLLKALAKRPDDRFASMEEFGRALRRGSLENTEAVSVAADPTTPPNAPPAASTKDGHPQSAPAAQATPRHLTEVSRPFVEPTDILATPLEHAPRQAPEAPEVSATVVVGASESAAIRRGVVSTSESSTPGADSSHVTPLPTTEMDDPPRARSLQWVAIPMAAVAILAAALTLALRPSSPEAESTGLAAAAAPAPQSTAPTKPPSPANAEAAHDEPPSVVTPPGNAPAALPPAPSPAADAPLPTPDSVAKPELAAPVDPPAEPTPPAPNDTRRSVEPKPSKRSSAKPKTDEEVVAALKANLLANCKKAGSTKVKVEGVISSTGTVGSLLITPPDEIGACAKKVVSRAKFDTTAGMRPMPRFSVDL